MDAMWTLAVLPTGAENLIELGSGREATPAAAAERAVDTLIRCAAALGGSGRQEYRVTVAGSQMIVTPGLAADGTVDLVALHDVADPQNWPSPNPR